MTVTVFTVYLMAADGTVDCELFSDCNRRVSEKAARRFRDQHAQEIQAGQSIVVKEERQRVDAQDFYPDDEDAFWDFQDRRAFEEEKVSLKARRPSEY